MCSIDVYAIRLAGRHVDLRRRLVVHRQDRAGERLRGERDQRREASVCAQLMSRGTFLKRTTSSRGRTPSARRPSRAEQHRQVDDVLASRLSPGGHDLARHLTRYDRVEPGLDPVDVRSGRRPRIGRSSRSRRSPRRFRPRTARRESGCRCGSRTSSDRASGRAGKRCGCLRRCTGRRGRGSRRTARARVAARRPSPSSSPSRRSARWAGRGNRGRRSGCTGS